MCIYFPSLISAFHRNAKIKASLYKNIFNDLTKTIFEHHKFPIEEMFCILKEMENKSTLQISKELGREYDSVLAFVREVQEIAEKIEEV